MIKIPQSVPRASAITRKTSAWKAHRAMQIAERRRQVALLMRTGLVQQEVAEQLDVSEATISGDVAANKQLLVCETLADMEAPVPQEMATLDGNEAYWRGELARAGSPAVLVRAYEQTQSFMGSR